MDTGSYDARLHTVRLDEQLLEGLPGGEAEVTYRLVPSTGKSADLPLWRVRLDPAFDPEGSIGLDINGEVVFGRGKDAPGFISLSPGDAATGISRRHATLRPTATGLYVSDLGSTNGTWLNGHSIGKNTPYSLSQGDRLRFGQLEFMVRIVNRPPGGTSMLRNRPDPHEDVLLAAKALSAQLDVNEVIKQALRMSLTLLSADVAYAWLADKQSGEIFLEGEQAVNDQHATLLHTPSSDGYVSAVMARGERKSVEHTPDGQPLETRDGQPLKAAIYAPLVLGGVAFGALAVGCKPERDHHTCNAQMLGLIADLTAIAVQNARLHQAAENALARSTKVLTALNYALSYDLKAKLNSMVGYAGMIESYAPDDDDSQAIAKDLVAVGEDATRFIDQIYEITTLYEEPFAQHDTCDMVQVVGKAVEQLDKKARQKPVFLDYNVIGTPCPTEGSSARLYRSITKLLTHAIDYSPPKGQVSVVLKFSKHNVIIRVRDTGEGLSDLAPPDVFEKYQRNGRTSEGQVTVELDLALVWATVEAHRGTVATRNTGSGSEFVITLPVARCTGELPQG